MGQIIAHFKNFCAYNIELDTIIILF